MARLDCDWHGENVRAFGAMSHPGLEFLPVETVGAKFALEVVARRKPADEDWWFVITGQHPQVLGSAAGPLFAAYARHGIKTLFYAFDEASRTMPVFPEIAPHLSVLIHDESPLDAGAQARLRPDCFVQHRSWVANLTPWAAPLKRGAGGTDRLSRVQTPVSPPTGNARSIFCVGVSRIGSPPSAIIPSRWRTAWAWAAAKSDSARRDGNLRLRR